MPALDAVRNVISSYSFEPTKDEMAIINGMPNEDAKKLEIAKLKLAKQQELTSFISNVLKQLHEMSMSVINNIR